MLNFYFLKNFKYFEIVYFFKKVEFRYPGADCNPYLAIASVISSGL